MFAYLDLCDLGPNRLQGFRKTTLVNKELKKAWKAKLGHWRISHNALTHMRNKNSNIQGRSANVVYHKELLSSWSKFFPLREVPHFEMGSK